MRRIGEIDRADLAAVSRLAGLDDVPYPFAPTRQGERRPSTTADGEFRRWTDAYATADIWLTCRVHHWRAGAADRRILGFRGGDTGYLARQYGLDAVEIFALHPDELGAAAAESIGLTRPGRRPRIVVPGYVGYFDRPLPPGSADADDGPLPSVLTAVAARRKADHHVAADDDVAAVAVIQSRWRPARTWGVDWTAPVIACIRIDGDSSDSEDSGDSDSSGDYVYQPDFSVAVPVDEQALSARISALTVADLEIAWQR